MEGERRVVTMLFCDVKGSTEAASHFDPEEWAGIINGAFECMIAPVYHYEGTVARLMGDGILAFFGAPIAHEDDPQRAILAALKILEDIGRYKDEVFTQWGVEIDARVGINTGLVVVGAVGSDLQVEYSALGDAINIAARMEQTAMQGSVQVSEETYKLIAPLFEFEDLGFVNVKGKSEPVHTYRPLRPKARTGTSGPGRLRGIEGLESPTIGREKEIATLTHKIENLTQHGVGAILFLTGEAGIGKSRLIREIQTTQYASHIAFYEIAPLSFEASQPYALFRSFLQQLTGVGEMESAEAARPKLVALAERLPIEVRGGVTGAFASVLGLEDDRVEQSADGESFKRQLFATAREAVHVHFAGVPGVIILDDLHWADPASLEIFNHLFPLVESVPILFLCATRPERGTPTWQLKTTLAEEFPHRFVEIPVQPLTTNDSNALVDHLLTVAELPPRIRTMILNKSEGNPFFLEEIIRALIEDGVLVRSDGTDGVRWRVSGEVETIEIPDNLQSLLAARLDRLTEDTRRVLQMASVIGRTFYYRVLQNITDSLNGLDGQLVTLQRANMILEAARLPELEFSFRHALVQETAYRSILRKQRREFHRRVGEAMEELFASRLDEYAPVLAMHFERAGDITRAFDYFLRAGDVAYRLYAVKEAISHYSQALEIVMREDVKRDHLTPFDTTQVRPDTSHLTSDHAAPDILRHLCLRLGRAFEMAGQYDEALVHYAEMEQFSQAHGDRELELAALAAHATIHSAPTDKFDPSLGEPLLRKAVALAEELGNHETEAKIYWNMMNMYGFSGQFEKGYEYGARSLEIARRYNLREQLAYTLNDYQRASMMARKIETAKEMLEEAQQLWLELGNKAMYIDSLVSAALLHIVLGDFEKVESLCMEALELSQEIGNLWGQSYSYYTLGFLYSEQGKFTQALEVMQNALRLAEPSGFVMPLIDNNAYTGLIYGYLGDYERGKSFALTALQNARERIPALEPGPLSILTIIDFWQGNLEAMEEWLGDSDPAPEINSFSGFGRFIAECYRLTAKGEYEKLLNLSAEILPHIRPFGALVFLAEILCMNGKALLALNRLDEARQFLNDAQTCSQHSPHRKIDILFALSRLESTLGNEEAAKACLAEAHQNIEIVLQNVSDLQLQTTYLARPEIKAILNTKA